MRVTLEVKSCKLTFLWCLTPSISRASGFEVELCLSKLDDIILPSFIVDVSLMLIEVVVSVVNSLIFFSFATSFLCWMPNFSFSAQTWRTSSNSQNIPLHQLHLISPVYQSCQVVKWVTLRGDLIALVSSVCVCVQYQSLFFEGSAWVICHPL